MKNTTLTRKLPTLLLAGFLGPAALASTALAAPSATFPTADGTAWVAPPAPGAAAAPQTPAAAPASTPAPAAPSPLEVERKLAELKYDVGPIDGNIDEQASSAIMAFQKVHGMERTGNLTGEVTTRILAAQGAPPPIAAHGEPDRIEVSLARQVLFLYRGGELAKILPVSSGTARTPTPTGEFRIYRQDPGWQTSHLGRLHNGQYFVGGYAIHGSLSVPAHPASHGCIRIPMSASEWFPSQVSRGMQVMIVSY